MPRVTYFYSFCNPFFLLISVHLFNSIPTTRVFDTKNAVVNHKKTGGKNRVSEPKTHFFASKKQVKINHFKKEAKSAFPPIINSNPNGNIYVNIRPARWKSSEARQLIN